MVPLNPLLKAPEAAYQLQDSEARLLINFEDFAAEAVAGAGQAGRMAGPAGSRAAVVRKFAEKTRRGYGQRSAWLQAAG